MIVDMEGNTCIDNALHIEGKFDFKDKVLGLLNIVIPKEKYPNVFERNEKRSIPKSVAEYLSKLREPTVPRFNS